MGSIALFSKPKLPRLWPHCQTSDHLASSITKSQTFGFLHFSQDGAYLYVLKIPGGVLILLLAGGGGGEGAGVGRREESVPRSLKELRNWRP